MRMKEGNREMALKGGEVGVSVLNGRRFAKRTEMRTTPKDSEQQRNGPGGGIASAGLVNYKLPFRQCQWNAALGGCGTALLAGR